jgi:hypothetical protein
MAADSSISIDMAHGYAMQVHRARKDRKIRRPTGLPIKRVTRGKFMLCSRFTELHHESLGHSLHVLTKHYGHSLLLADFPPLGQKRADPRPRRIVLDSRKQLFVGVQELLQTCFGWRTGVNVREAVQPVDQRHVLCGVKPDPAPLGTPALDQRFLRHCILHAVLRTS